MIIPEYKDIIISDDVKEIEDYRYHFANISSIKIGKGVQKLGYRSIYCCMGLTEVEIPGNVKIIGRDVFLGCKYMTKAIIHEGVEEIDDFAFEGCALEDVVLPSTLKRLGACAFHGCPIKDNLLIVPDGCIVGNTGFKIVYAKKEDYANQLHIIKNRNTIIDRMIHVYKMRKNDTNEEQYQENIDCLEMFKNNFQT